MRVVEVKGNGSWLRLAKSEKPVREPPLSLGDSVLVVSGQYKGERGSVAKELNDKREAGVKLKG